MKFKFKFIASLLICFNIVSISSLNTVFAQTANTNKNIQYTTEDILYTAGSRTHGINLRDKGGAWRPSEVTNIKDYNNFVYLKVWYTPDQVDMLASSKLVDVLKGDSADAAIDIITLLVQKKISKETAIKLLTKIMGKVGAKKVISVAGSKAVSWAIIVKAGYDLEKLLLDLSEAEIIDEAVRNNQGLIYTYGIVGIVQPTSYYAIDFWEDYPFAWAPKDVEGVFSVDNPL